MKRKLYWKSFLIFAAAQFPIFLFVAHAKSLILNEPFNDQYGASGTIAILVINAIYLPCHYKWFGKIQS
ncbi:hypothetical protein RRK67_004065 [Vibrio fluvialis]|nr:hypothetical protein [Vibrio fluvialis]